MSPRNKARGGILSEVLSSDPWNALATPDRPESTSFLPRFSNASMQPSMAATLSSSTGSVELLSSSEYAAVGLNLRNITGHWTDPQQLGQTPPVSSSGGAPQLPIRETKDDARAATPWRTAAAGRHHNLAATRAPARDAAGAAGNIAGPIKPSAANPVGAGGGECTGPRKAGALGGESYELSANEGARGGGVAVEADVFPASPPMASTDRRKLEMRIDWIGGEDEAEGNCGGRPANVARGISGPDV
nr:unnamed protein product [Digitaria exilis]